MPPLLNSQTMPINNIKLDFMAITNKLNLKILPQEVKYNINLVCPLLKVWQSKGISTFTFRLATEVAEVVPLIMRAATIKRKRVWWLHRQQMSQLEYLLMINMKNRLFKMQFYQLSAKLTIYSPFKRSISVLRMMRISMIYSLRRRMVRKSLSLPCILLKRWENLIIQTWCSSLEMPQLLSDLNNLSIVLQKWRVMSRRMETGMSPNLQTER